MNAFVGFATIVAACFIALFGAGALLGVIRLIAPWPAQRPVQEARDAAAGPAVTGIGVRATGIRETGRSAMAAGMGGVPVAA